MAFFFPQAHAEIDWARGYTFLDKELQQAVRDAELGRRLADKLVQVWRRSGDEAWVLVHIEVQSQEESDFARRMFVYYYRLFDRYNRRIASLAVLGDERAGWRPDAFGADLWGCQVQFTFPVIKLLDYRAQWSTLEASRNPFATVVMAHLKAQETRQDAPSRERAKLMLTRRMYDLGYGREEIINLYRFIDWLLKLPKDLELHFWQEIQQFEETRQMPYISSVEEFGIQKGLEQGLHQGREQGLQQGREQGLQQGLQQGRREGLLDGIALVLEVKFGEDGRQLMDEIRSIEDLALIQAIYDRLKTAATIDELRRVYTNAE